MHLMIIIVHSCVLSHFSNAWLFVTLWAVACQAPLSMGFSRQEYQSGLPCPPSGESSQPRDRTHISCGSYIAGGFFTTEPLKKPCIIQASAQMVPWRRRLHALAQSVSQSQCFLLLCLILSQGTQNYLKRSHLFVFCVCVYLFPVFTNQNVRFLTN